MLTHQWTRGLKAVGLGLVTLAGTASAQQATPDVPGPIDSLQDLQDSGKMVFKSIDANNDGQISQQEAIDGANIAVGGLFFSADADGNGVLSREEAQRARDKVLAAKPMARFLISRVRSANPNPNPAGGTQNPAAMAMTMVDTNRDGQLQASEVRQVVQTVVQGLFAAADTNRDGQMSPSEINAAIIGAARAAAQATFQAADNDNNGQLSREEFSRSITEPANALFGLVDTNNDGQLSQQEAQSAQRMVMSRLQMLQVPEPANSAGNLIESGRGPGQTGQPIPDVGGQNKNQRRRPNRANPGQGGVPGAGGAPGAAGAPGATGAPAQPRTP